MRERDFGTADVIYDSICIDLPKLPPGVRLVNVYEAYDENDLPEIWITFAEKEE